MTIESKKTLGMDRPIKRRDILHGMGLITAGSLIPGTALADQVLASEENGNTDHTYPPALIGIRGNHPGSFEVAHQLAREGRSDWGKVAEPDDNLYDLVIVGAGISGLSAAYFYRKQHPHARVLIVDNHDDFGGHAKRNEFEVNGRTLLSYGGAQTLEEPSSYSDLVKGLLTDLGVDLNRFYTAYDQQFFKKNKLGAGIHFNKNHWGTNKLVRFDLGSIKSFLPVAESQLTPKQAVDAMPISEPSKKQLLHLLLEESDQLPEMDENAKWEYLSKISYRDFLNKHLRISEPEVFAVLQDMFADSGLGIEAATAAGAVAYAGLPGWDAAGLPEYGEDEAYIHHFPDGNASVARLLVRHLIPEVAKGRTLDDVIIAKFDYSKLDNKDSAVRLRLNSTVVRVDHDGKSNSRDPIDLVYMQHGQTYKVKGKNCILACNNSIIPYLCPHLPEDQQQALKNQIKSPILYTSVALNNWRAWHNLGIGAVVSPGSYHILTMLDFPVSLGGYSFAAKPDEPIVVHMERFPHRSNEGLTEKQQFRLGRHELLSTSFETIELNVRRQLSEILGEGGFDPARDIEAVTANRWAHGYSAWYNPLFDTVYEDDDDERYPHMRARKPFGRIAIANADSAANAIFYAAVEQAHRAIMELV
ncbi:MAG: NAD(P)-binding protein [Pseudomonadales bacterium]